MCERFITTETIKNATAHIKMQIMGRIFVKFIFVCSCGSKTTQDQTGH